MNEEYQLIKGMTIETARRYIKVRKELEIIINRIHNFGELICLDKETEQIGSRIKTDSILILRMLDINFVIFTPFDLNRIHGEP